MEKTYLIETNDAQLALIHAALKKQRQHMAESLLHTTRPVAQLEAEIEELDALIDMSDTQNAELGPVPGGDINSWIC